MNAHPCAAPEGAMKGVVWNGDTIVTKGTGRSESKGMFSVGGLVAFSTFSFCSPDGNESGKGVELLSAGYLLKEEIELEEFDRSYGPGEGSPVGYMDVQKVVNLKDRFTHQKEYSMGSSYFVCGVLATDAQQIPEGLLVFTGRKRIEEIRKNPGKWLHVYEVGKASYEIAERETDFLSAVAAIIAAKRSEEEEIDRLLCVAAEKRSTTGAAFTLEGIEAAKKAFSLLKGIGRGESVHGVGRIIEFIDELNTGQAVAIFNGDRLKIGERIIAGDKDVIREFKEFTDDGKEKKGIKKGMFSAWGGEIIVHKIVREEETRAGKYCGSLHTRGVLDIFREDDGFSYQTNRHERDGKWEKRIFHDIPRFEISSGEEGEMKEYNNERDARALARKEKFQALSKVVLEKYDQKVMKLAQGKKGQAIKTLGVIAEHQGTVNKKEMEKILRIGRDANEVGNLIALVGAGICPKKAGEIAEKARAWAYLGNAGMPVCLGYFDEAKEALEIYSKNWG